MPKDITLSEVYFLKHATWKINAARGKKCNANTSSGWVIVRANFWRLVIIQTIMVFQRIIRRFVHALRVIDYLHISWRQYGDTDAEAYISTKKQFAIECV